MDLNKKITRKNGRISLGLSCADFYSKNKQNRKRIRINESDARKILEEEGLNPGEAHEKKTLDNKSGVTEASFVFEDLNHQKPAPQVKIEEPQQPAPTRTSRRKKRKTQQNSEKSQKNLDNIEKDVIIKETITEE